MTSADKDQQAQRIASWVCALGVVMVAAAVGLAIAACWSHGDMPQRLAATAFIVGFVGLVVAGLGFVGATDD